MTVQITDTATFKSYTATCRADCRGVDANLWDMLEITGEPVVRMGQIIANRVG